jgi:hypothetical protein
LENKKGDLKIAFFILNGSGVFLNQIVDVHLRLLQFGEKIGRGRQEILILLFFRAGTVSGFLLEFESHCFKICDLLKQSTFDLGFKFIDFLFFHSGGRPNVREKGTNTYPFSKEPQKLYFDNMKSLSFESGISFKRL